MIQENHYGPAVGGKPSKIYICHADHEHDRVYTENVAEYLDGKGVSIIVIQLDGDSSRSDLRRSLEDPEAAVLSFNAVVDHAWLASESFLDIAERRGLPVVQWILDHPSARWGPVSSLDADQLAVSAQFRSAATLLRDLLSAWCADGGNGWRGTQSALAHSRAELWRLYATADNLPGAAQPARIRRIDESEAAMVALDPPLAGAVRDAIASARDDLFGSLHSHVAAALAANRQAVSPERFDVVCQLVEEAVQTYRRLKIFSVAKSYPALIQSDDSAARFAQGSAASFASNVGMRATLEQMPNCRAVLSVTPMSDMIHDRTMNALNAGCVAIAEDDAANRDVLTHGENALLFRYDDDSLAECLEILCGQPERVYGIAKAGMRLRDDPRIRFGQQHRSVSCP